MGLSEGDYYVWLLMYSVCETRQMVRQTRSIGGGKGQSLLYPGTQPNANDGSR